MTNPNPVVSEPINAVDYNSIVLSKYCVEHWPTHKRAELTYQGNSLCQEHFELIKKPSQPEEAKPAGKYRCDKCGYLHPQRCELEATALSDTIQIGNKVFEFSHTAVNKDIHMFIGSGDSGARSHDPRLCPECIEPGSLSE